MKFTIPIACVVALVLTSRVASAGEYIVDGARVVSVANTASNQTVFIVKTSGGTGACTNGSWITFSPASAPDADTYKRAYTAALLAFTTGALVKIYNYSSGTCDGASFIELDN
jgi:hypothetical protein